MESSQHLVCPHCESINRIPVDHSATGTPSKDAAVAQCGKCHQPLFLAKALDVNAEQFVRHISKSDLPVIVDFWADWCQPCKVLGPVLAQAAKQLEPKIRFLKVNTDENQALMGQYAIRGIPTLIIFKNGSEVSRQSGAMDLGTLNDWILNTL